MMVLPEQIRELQPGDEDSLTYANVRRKLALARASLDVRRVAIVAADLTARGDSDGRLGLGAQAYELGADRAEIARARTGAAIASPLFTGHDGLPYKRGYAAIGSTTRRGDVAGFAVVEASADYLVALAAFRRWLLTASAITRRRRAGGDRLHRRGGSPGRSCGSRARRSASAAASWRRAMPIETRDEIGLLATTLDDMRAALQARDERLQMMLAGIAHEVRNPLGGLELYAGLLRDALGGEPERLQEVARIERELGYLKTVVNEFLDYARRPAAGARRRARCARCSTRSASW